MAKSKNKGKNACSYKVRYMNQEQAEFFGKPVNLRSYECPHCKQWHNSAEGELGFGKKAAKRLAA